MLPSPIQSLKDVFHATVIGKLIYCAPAWHGFCLASDYSRLNSFLCYVMLCYAICGLHFVSTAMVIGCSYNKRGLTG